MEAGCCSLSHTWSLVSRVIYFQGNNSPIELDFSVQQNWLIWSCLFKNNSPFSKLPNEDKINFTWRLNLSLDLKRGEYLILCCWWQVYIWKTICFQRKKNPFHYILPAEENQKIGLKLEFKLVLNNLYFVQMLKRYFCVFFFFIV